MMPTVVMPSHLQYALLERQRNGKNNIIQPRSAAG